MMAFGIATTSALTSRVPAGHGGGVGVACAMGCAGSAAGVAGVASVFATAASVFVAGSDAFGSVASVVFGAVASTTGLRALVPSTATFGVCARAVVTANKLRPSIVNEVTT